MSRSELWIGLVELKARNPKAFGATGAFINIVTWASHSGEFRSKAELLADSLELDVVDVEDVEPIFKRSQQYTLTPEVRNLMSQASTDQQAILYGSFHRFSSDGD